MAEPELLLLERLEDQGTDPQVVRARVREIQERYCDVCVSDRQRLPRRYFWSPYWRSSEKRLEAERWAAEAGLFSSCARFAASLPRAESFSACCSMRVTSRTRSSSTETQR